jgi:hypothetical protein
MNQHERCECHDCTQARYAMSSQNSLGSMSLAHSSFVGPHALVFEYSSNGPISSVSNGKTSDISQS